MSKSLVIVESPAKAKTIGKYLGNQFVVKASLGHIKDLPKSDLAVDVDRGFEPTYEVIEGKKKLIGELRAAAKGVDSIYLAADPDREGEAICYHLQEELASKKADGPKIFRVMFNEITASAVRKAFDNPLQVNTNLVDAQQARRVLDRLVGYKISPLLWDKVRRGLSAGRDPPSPSASCAVAAGAPERPRARMRVRRDALAACRFMVLVSVCRRRKGARRLSPPHASD